MVRVLSKMHHNRFVQNHHSKSYLTEKITSVMPKLLARVVQEKNGYFQFVHQQFPDMYVSALTMLLVEQNLERMLKKELKDKSNKHIDYIFNLLIT